MKAQGPGGLIRVSDSLGGLLDIFYWALAWFLLNCRPALFPEMSRTARSALPGATVTVTSGDGARPNNGDLRQRPLHPAGAAFGHI